MKAVEIIRTAIEAIGVYAPGENMTAADAARGLRLLNSMMDGWSNENQASYAFLTQSLVLVNNQTRYSIGPDISADVNSVRPLKLVQCYMTDELGNNYPIAIVQQYEWNEITNKEINGQIPTCVFYDPQFPIAYLNFWPAPYLPWTVSFTSYLQLQSFPNLFTDLQLPRGYVPALQYNLAIELAPFYGKAVNPVIAELASKYLANIKRTNWNDIPAVYEMEIVANGMGNYSVFNDSFGGPRGGFGG